MATFVVDGDKGGVGKSFLSRAIADYLIINKSGGRVVVIDCDQSSPDVVGEAGFHDHEQVGAVEVAGLSSPVSSQEDWFATIDRAVAHAQDGTDFVLSLPAGAGLFIDDTVLDALALIAPVVTIWTMGKDTTSITQLEERVARAPAYYETGIIAINEYHGSLSRGAFDAWIRSSIRHRLVANGMWREITVPVLNAFITKRIGTMPHHRAVALSANNGISPTISIGIAAFRRAFHAQLGKAIGEIMGGA